MKIEQMSRSAASEIVLWHYPPPYEIYSVRNTPETMSELLGGSYYSARVCMESRGKSQLAGYFCYGGAARIDTLERGVYALEATDIGLGMRPDLCGMGLGAEFVSAGLEFCGEAGLMRLAVAEFNVRAIKVYEKCGFRYFRTVTQRGTGREYLIMLK